MKYLRMNLLLTITFISFSISTNSFGQMIMKTVVNEITQTNWINESQMTVQNDNTIAIAFKRGEGSTLPDNQIWVAVSNDGGKTFSEQDISFPGYKTQGYVDVSSSKSCLIVTYDMDDANDDDHDCIARSFDGGKTFHLDSTTKYNDTFISDGTTRLYRYSGSSLWVSEDNCSTWTEIPAFPPVADYSNDFKVTEDYMLAAAYNHKDDSLYVYYSDDRGESFKMIDAFYTDMPDEDCYGIAVYKDDFTVVYVHEEVGTYFLRYKNLDVNGVVDEGTIIETTSSIGDYKLLVHRYKDHLSTTDGGSHDELYFSKDNGTTWKGKYEIGGSDFHFKKGYYYVIDDEITTGELRDIILEKWELTDKPYITSPGVKDTSILEPNSGNDYYIVIGARNTWVTDSLTYQFQVAADSTFGDVKIDTALESTAFSIHTYFYKLNEHGKKYYVRVRCKKDTMTTGWSEYIRFSFGEITGISFGQKLFGAGFRLSQNQNSIKLVFTNPVSANKSSVRIYNAMGKDVLKQNAGNADINSTVNCDIRGLSSGIYFLEVTSGAGSGTIRHKFNVLR